jgi:hypothetical protein
MINGQLNYWGYHNQLYDELGNRRKSYKIARYEKDVDGSWHKVEEKTTSYGSTFVINNKIYFKVDDSLIPVNMDFNNSTCGACEQIIGEVPIGRKITKNEIMFQHECAETKEALSLHKQYYSDGTCFYSLQDKSGDFCVNYGSDNLQDLIEQMELEIKCDKRWFDKKFEDYPQNIKEIYSAVLDWHTHILNSLIAIT